MRHHGSSHVARWAVRGTVTTVAAATAIYGLHLLSGKGGDNVSTDDAAAGGTANTDPLQLIHKATGLTPVELAVVFVVLVVLLVGSAVVWPGGSKKAPGFATSADIHRNMSKKSARRSGRKTRPSLAARKKLRHEKLQWVPALQRAPLSRSHWSEYAIRMGEVGRHDVFGTFEETITIFGPTGSYKSVFLAGVVMDAPGAVVVTTTKLEDVEATLRVRATRGRPVYVFNPYELGGDQMPNSFRWSPVLGCHREQTAISRAGYLLYGARSGAQAGDSINDFFKSTACEVLRAYLMAAALAGLNMRDVYRWATNADDDEAVKILEHANARPDWVSVLKQRQATTDRTRDGIYTTLSTALSWMADPVIAEAACPEEPADSFDVEDFINRRGTLYLLAEDRLQGSVAPLFTMAMGHLVEEGKAIAAQMPGRRLDPPVLLVLDEVANICPVPLPKFFSELRGHGFTPAAAVQSRSQMREVWGVNGAETIWNNSAWTLILAGIKSTEDLRTISDMIGTHTHRKANRQQGPNGTTVSYTTTQEPIITPAGVRRLPPRRILAIHRGSPPVMVTVASSWKRKDVRAAGKAVEAANKKLRKAAEPDA